ncbi:MAG: nucleoside 2-deoxyribosyltransferase [Halobacteriota archaeon]|nr:nucleoside 2-deoxyribosyltransferase [Halobacteriota archaeon]
MIKIYIAGPLFSEAEREYNTYLSKYLEHLGFETFLPQRDGLKLSELLKSGASELYAMEQIFRLDISEIQRSDIVVFIMDGRVPDEGACVEIGYACALGKECIAVKTDPRTLISDMDNPLIVGAVKNRIASNPDELKNFLLACEVIK